MTPQSFCYWLQGYFELSDSGKLTQKQVETIKRHLDMVFEHSIDPSLGDKEHREELRKIHDGDESKDTKTKVPVDEKAREKAIETIIKSMKDQYDWEHLGPKIMC